MNQHPDSMIHFRCSRCFRALKAKRSAIGQSLRCPACHHDTVVPSESLKQAEEKDLYPLADGDAPGRVHRNEGVTVRCDVCGTRVTGEARQTGKTIPCPDCGSPVLMRVAQPTPPQAPRVPLVYEGDSVYGIRQEHDGGSESTSEGDTSADRAAHDGLIPVVCRLCGTRMHADQHEAGKAKRCPDCESVMIVPPPIATVLKETLKSVTFEGTSTYETDGTNPAFDAEAEVIPVVCRLCGTRMYAPAGDAGKEKPCPDCGTRTTIPDAAPIRYQAAAGGAGTYASVAPSASPEPRVGVDYRELQRRKDLERRSRNPRGSVPRSADPASSMGDEKSLTIIHVEPRTELPARLYFSNLFTFASDWQFRMMYVGISLGLAVSFVLVKHALVNIAQGDAGSVLTGLFFLVFGGAATLISAGALSFYCLLIVSDTAEGADHIEAWPIGFDSVAWFAHGLRMGMLLVLSGAPGALIGQYGIGSSEAMVIGCGVSVFLLFPYITLSHLSTGTILEPISLPLAQTWFRVPGVWAGFYLLTGFGILLFVVLPLYLCQWAPWFEYTLVPLAVAFSAILYFRLLGRLGWKCSDAIRSRDDAEPSEDF